MLLWSSLILFLSFFTLGHASERYYRYSSVTLLSEIMNWNDKFDGLPLLQCKATTAVVNCYFCFLILYLFRGSFHNMTCQPQ